MIRKLEHALVTADDIIPGDVILCYSPDMREARSGRESGYSHAAICCERGSILESSGGGVRLTNAAALLDEYGHVAVLRNTKAWDGNRLSLLSKFADASLGKQFNLSGLKEYDAQREEALSTQLRRIKGYFDNDEAPEARPSSRLFCSELVVSAFIETGVIGKSAAPAFRPCTFLPQDIAIDLIFGFFIGYILPYPGYRIPEDDLFINYALDENFMKSV
ncbi:hypothetical protein GCM10011572_46990 [Pseudoduganella buxea]|nr:hypothetical protein GCM10011572_46990 [Pseudoduganella buxea]